MKRVWKPVGLMGLRLYKVFTAWPNPVGSGHPQRIEQSVVAANAPMEAAEIVRKQYEEMPLESRPSCRGEALNVCQPAEWWEGITPSVSPSNCKHHRSTTVCGGSGAGDGFSWREDVSLCLDCGEIHVSSTKNGEHFSIRFGLSCDDHIRAAAHYMRSELETADAIEWAKR